MKSAAMLTVAAVAVLAIGACSSDRDRTDAGAAAGGNTGVLVDRAELVRDARELVGQASRVVDRMKADPALRPLLERAKGVFIVPEYGKGAAVVGARGGEGVLFAHDDGRWAGPLFADIGAVSVGPQIGGAGGNVAMLLMSDHALHGFTQRNAFSFDADAGFTLGDSGVRSQASTDEDVILWSDMEGAFAGVSLGVSDIALDTDENRAFYGQPATPEQILRGEVESQYAEGVREKLNG
jgi:lipid-binding SYLF domain-containing protein